MPMVSASSSAIDSRCVDIITATPERAWATNRSLTIRALRGSRPTSGSSTIRTLGSWTSAAAKTTRCFIPCE
jgi:hypothetical protein